MSAAVEEKRLPSNPVTKTTTPASAKPTRFRELSAADLKRLLAGFVGREPYYLVTALAIATGARRNELLALRWCDIDFDRCVVSITRSVQEVVIAGKGQRSVKGPKSDRGTRSLVASRL